MPITHVAPTIPVTTFGGISASQLISHPDAVNTQSDVVIVPASGLTYTMTASNTAVIGTDITLTADCSIVLPSTGTQCWCRVRQTTVMTSISATTGVITKGGPYRVLFSGGGGGTWVGPTPIMSGGAGAVDLYAFSRAATTDGWTGMAFQNLTDLSVNAQEYVYIVTASTATVTLPSPGLAVGSDVTLSANCSITLPPGAVGLQCWAYVRQPATGGSYVYTVTFLNPGTSPPAVRWVRKLVPVMSTGAAAYDLY